MTRPSPPASPSDPRPAAPAAPAGQHAPAAGPVAAATVVRTGADGLEAGWVRLRSGDLDVPAYRAQPAGRSGLPVVLVVSEIFGVHEHIADVARRLAHEGYLAIAPELFVRQGDAGAYTDMQRLVAEVVSRAPDAQVLADLDATVNWAAANGGDVARLGLTGFCWGGRVTWLYAAHQPRVRAGVAWYGRLQGPTDALRPRHPVDVAPALHAPVLGLYGGRDASIPLESVEAMRAALRAAPAAARGSEIVVYPQAWHAFHADYRPMYDAEAAHDGWRRCLAWLRANGVA